MKKRLENEEAVPQVSKTAEDEKPNFLTKEAAVLAQAINREFPAGNPTDNEFPIIAYDRSEHCENMPTYDSIAGSVTTSVESETGFFKKMKECDFNMVIWEKLLIGARYFSTESLKQFYIPLTKDLGIRFGFMIESVALRTYPQTDFPKYEGTSILAYMVPKLNKFLVEYGYEDWVWGWMFKDEPKADAWRLPLDQMPNTTVPLESNYNLCAINAAPEKVSFFNLACAVRSDFIGSEISGKQDMDGKVLSIKEQYMLYLGELCRKVHPKMLSYDFYPVLYRMKDNHVATNVLMVRDDYFQYLEAIAEFSQINGMPIWAIILSNQHNLYATHDENGITKRDYLTTAYPLPTEGVLRFQAFNAMAFGMQGIVYWTYSMPPVDMRDQPSTLYIDAPVKYEQLSGLSDSKEDKPPYRYTYTSIWQAAKTVNAEIKQYGKILLGAKYLESKHVYGPKKEVQFIGAKELGSSTIGCIHSASTNGKGFVICRLKKDDVNYLAIVSHDPAESQRIKLGISAKYYCYRGEYGINALPIDYTPGPNQNPATVVNFAFNLLPGDMIILSYKHRLVDA